MGTESAKTPPQERLSRTRDDDRELSALARHQHGLVGRRQLLACGWSGTAIDKRIRSGRLHRVHPGVYCVGHRLLSRQGRWTAAVLASGPEALLSHRSAAALWGLRGHPGGAIHVTAPRKSTSTQRIRRHFSIVPHDERGVQEGIPATSVHRTIFDLAATEPVEAVAAMIREAEYLGRCQRLSLPDLLERHPGRRGSRRLRLALRRIGEEPAGRKRSRLEERFAPFLRRYRLPLPRFNDWILLGPKRFQVDCHWPGHRLIVELDGWEGHSSRSAFQEDRARDRALRVVDYSVIRLTWSQLEAEAEAVASDLRRLLPEKEE
ncbi:MAG TPA: type IV toxin-antitoxin system AbiEi family antitoxin domain-containing protein [Solirubrobacterales bacterium]|nr:type IV toxin-antitoxin system AbiEi family antitoxin domain-containing protein [Solirubrobacterales bacterium]